MEKLNLGVIGLGYIGKVHLRNCLKLNSVRVVAVADTSKKALNYAREFGIKQLFTGYHELLKLKDLDAVIISLPTHLHADCAISAAEERKHVFLEKPLARNLKEGREIVSAIRKNGVQFMVGYPFRFVLKFVNLKRHMESGVLGDIQIAHAVNISTGPFFHRAESTMPHPVPEWWLNKEFTGGGALMDLGCHMINLMRWYFGEIKSIKAYLGHRFDLEVEDYAVCISDFECGTTAIINVGWFSQKTVIGIELYGTMDYASSFHHSQSKVKTAVKLLLGGTSEFFKPYLKELIHFVDCINKDIKPVSSGLDAIKDLEAITQAYKNQIDTSQL
ncbi:MAG: Gfo/Idh/MocA family oxidoreductase [Candidatus Bathyarchaeia archaeon]